MTTLTEADVEAAAPWLEAGYNTLHTPQDGRLTRSRLSRIPCSLRCKAMDWRDYISSDPGVCHGRACITGTRVMVTIILDSLGEGLDVEEITTHYPSVSKEAVRAALLYAAELAKERIMPLEV